MDIGELDGATSNTILLEQQRGWDGLLIEADPSAYTAVKQQDRKCWTALCAEDSTPPCHSLTSMLNDLGRTHVDFFSLRIADNTLAFLQSAIEWTTVSVAIWAIHPSQAEKAQVAALLHAKGYSTQSDTMTPSGDSMIFVHPEHVAKMPATPLSQYLPSPFPTVKEVVINIGSNTDPISSPNRGLCLVFEPVVYEEAAATGRRNDAKSGGLTIVIPGAVSDKSSTAIMYKYNRNGVSSSLSKPKTTNHWNENAARGDGSMLVTPVFSLEDILDAIPREIPITHAKLDMQGYDFVAVSAVPQAKLVRVEDMETEVYTGTHVTYKDTTNSFCKQWLPHMTKMNMEVTRLTTAYQGAENIEVRGADNIAEYFRTKDTVSTEADAFWKPRAK